MRYIVKELINGPDNLGDCRDLELKECKDTNEAIQLTEKWMRKGFELKRKSQKKDYDKILHVELYFQKKENE